VKVGAMIKAYRELGILDDVLAGTSQTKVDAIREMESMLFSDK
jgi:hypothetical protein